MASGDVLYSETVKVTDLDEHKSAYQPPYPQAAVQTFVQTATFTTVARNTQASEVFSSEVNALPTLTVTGFAPVLDVDKTYTVTITEN